jgi:hypothetical protein
MKEYGDAVIQIRVFFTLARMPDLHSQDPVSSQHAQGIFVVFLDSQANAELTFSQVAQRFHELLCHC